MSKLFELQPKASQVQEITKFDFVCTELFRLAELPA